VQKGASVSLTTDTLIAKVEIVGAISYSCSVLNYQKSGDLFLGGGGGGLHSQRVMPTLIVRSLTCLIFVLHQNGQ